MQGYKGRGVQSKKMDYGFLQLTERPFAIFTKTFSCRYMNLYYLCIMQNGNKYTESQIERAKKAYNEFIAPRTIESFDPEFIGWNTAEQQWNAHCNMVNAIANGDKELEREWKMFFLNEVMKSDRKMAERKLKLAANKEASSDVLAAVKAAGRKLGDYYKWLNTYGNEFRKEFFSKKYTAESVAAFLSI